MSLSDRKILGGALTPVVVSDIKSVSAPITIQSSDSASIDAFGRWRVSNPVGLFDSQLQYNAFPLLWQTQGTGTATHIAVESSVRMRVTGGQTLTRQTRAYFRYQPGKSQWVLMTFADMGGEVGVTRRVGYFDAQNGVFLESTGDGIFLARRDFTKGLASNQLVPQNQWNLDVMDGSGNANNPSGVNIDVNNAQILIIDFEWLGTGRVRAGFFVSGVPVYCHEFLHANIFTSVYMTTANLPLRYEITADIGVVGNHDLKHICSSVISEGGFETERGIPFGAGNGATEISITTRRPIFSIRPRALFNGIVNRATIITEIANVYSEDEPVFCEIVYGGTLTNPSWANVDTTYSVTEMDIAASAISGGIVVLGNYIAANSPPPAFGSGAGVLGAGVTSKLPLTLDIDGGHPTSPLTDVLSIVMTSMTGLATDTSAVINWRELR